VPEKNEAIMRREELYGMTRGEALAFLRSAPVIHVASINRAGMPVLRTVHGVVVDDYIAFHGSPEGEKTECDGRPVVLSAEEIVAQIPSYFIDPVKACPATTYYRSVQVHGVLQPIDDPIESALVLQQLMEKFQPEGGHKTITAEDPIYKGAVKNLMISKVSLQHLDGKAKLGQNRKPEELQRIIEALWRRGGASDLRAITLLRHANPSVTDPVFLQAPTGPHSLPTEASDPRQPTRKFCVTPTEQDAIEAAALLRDTYWNTNVSQDQLVRAHLSATAWLCVHDEAGRVVASARAISDQSKWSIIYDVIVAPQLQRTGIGQALFKLLLDHPMVRGAIGVRLGTRDAQTFYEKFGFVDVLTRPLRAYKTTEMLLLRSRA
jgi:nitroimidazol reductase NimA-like FMN-containing flavoprotein (pyridoxamine 5'-phosphate oxidase superfamily)/predicted N-acetyltransferase YhbS